MKAVDFEYDGRNLSDFGFIVCEFNGGGSTNSASVGSTINFNMVSHHSGKKHSLSSSEYSDRIAAEFDICKNPDYFPEDNMYITDQEMRELLRWLNRREFHNLRFFCNDMTDYNAPTYHASFNAKKMYVGANVCAIRLTMETDSPFAYGKEVIYNLKFTSGNKMIRISDPSDDIGLTYPNLVIKCNEDGSLTLKNDMTNCDCTILNCKEGETITIFGNEQIIESDCAEHDIYNDFNYHFFSVSNSLNNRYNNIESSINCDVKISYFPTVRNVM